ncbi:MAG TPA: L-2-hydroxyglutarate oxidase [Baekduia sp.]|uniref:L-2-hydroxyglutarate oxidase n=1 Tax=Baekduia sp. TaxID=2600305 RepID=UPI002D79180A|nr:L-2-hydroxyglutarate oxidase [Baekduia sp.]HET6506108.1 L-2-hydroxyglutarate oxidase [Baekduia sp.]
MNGTERIGVVGAGIVGLAVARRIAEVAPGARVTVLDKEHAVAVHQTGHNSGVAHAGLYYQPGSLKARLCRRGIELLKALCEERGLPYDECGKLVVARDESEIGRLRDIERRATENGVPGLRWLEGAARMREVEPNVVGVAAVHSPATAIVDFKAVAGAFADDVRAAGGELRLGREVTSIAQRGDEVRVVAGGEEHAFDRLILCAGLQSDRVARLAGDDDGPAIVPFRGEYLRLKDGRSDLVKGLIYPVPDPAFPFLGVHFTRRVDGGLDIGPNAVLAFAREGYTFGRVVPRDLAATLGYSGFRKLAVKYWRTGLKEMRGSVAPGVLVREARTFVPSLRREDVERAPAGVRAQAIDPDGSMVDDFRVNHVGRVVAVRNAPSPAATSSLAIAEHVVGLALGS